MAHSRELPDSFSATLDAMLATRSAERRWTLLDHLSLWPDEAYATATTLLEHRGLVRRIRGAELMGALVQRRPDWIPEYARTLIRAFDRETDASLLSFIVFSLQWCIVYEGEAPPVLVDGTWRWASRRRRPHSTPLVWSLMTSDRIDRLVGLASHPDALRRKEMAIALEQFIGLDRRILDALIRLARDPETEPRDWATFALAVSAAILERPEANDPEVMAALRDRLHDQEAEIRNEVAYGLALRRDLTAIEVVDRQLRDREVSAVLFDAAIELEAPSLVPALEYVARWWPLEDCDRLCVALAACGHAQRLEAIAQ